MLSLYSILCILKKMYLSAKNKFEFINGIVVAPKDGHFYQPWKKV